jgi:hypothetical protein
LVTIRPTALPSFGQIAPKMSVEAARGSLGAEGRVPRFAERRVILFFGPTRALVGHFPPTLA